MLLILDPPSLVFEDGWLRIAIDEATMANLASLGFELEIRRDIRLSFALCL
jgi:hypothetical protein